MQHNSPGQPVPLQPVADAPDWGPDPVAVVMEWRQQARETPSIAEPDAMSLATLDSDGRPCVRIVLWRQLDTSGAFTFFTNLHSNKGAHLLARPSAALCVHWQPLGRQLRAEGTAHQVADDVADAYFAQRPRESQLGAWASNQSAVLSSRQELLDRFDAVTKLYDGKPVPRPPHWSGFRVQAAAIELWQDGAHRLHHRRRYVRNGAAWTSTLMNP